MFIKNTALLALGASAVVASPLNKRQASSVISSVAGSASSAASSAVGSVTGSASSAAESVTGSAAATGSGASSSTAVSPSSGAESATSALGSAVSSAATGTSSAPLPTATTEANATSAESYAFGCPDSYSISYVVGTAPYANVSIEQAYSALANWGSAIPPPIESLNSTGEGEGAERSWALSLGDVNLTVSEVLTRVNETPSTFLEQEWNLTMPITVSPSLIISNYTNVLTLYSNSTSNETTAQLFSNFCASDQPAGIELYSQLVTAYLSGLQTLFTNSTASGNSTAASTTSMMSSSMASSMASSSAASGTSSVASAASSGASGVVGTASSAVAGAISTATGAPASVATSLVGALTSVI